MKNLYFLIAGIVALSLIACSSPATMYRSSTTEGKQTTPQTHSLKSPLRLQPKATVTKLENKVTVSPQINNVSTKSITLKLDGYPRQPLNLRDQVQLGSDFYQFRQHLRRAVRNHDAKFIRSIATPNIKLTLGPPQTIDDLDIDNPNAPIWLRMEKAFSTGCDKWWVCPHVQAVWPKNLEPHVYVAIVGENVNVRSQARTDSQLVGVLSNEAVKFDDQVQQSFNFDNPNQRTAIILPNGRRGYLINRYVYSPLGYRGSFGKIGEEWKMFLFLDGD